LKILLLLVSPGDVVTRSSPPPLVTPLMLLAEYQTNSYTVYEARLMCCWLQRVSCRHFISHRTPSPDHWLHSRWARMNRVAFIFSLFYIS